MTHFLVKHQESTTGEKEKDARVNHQLISFPEKWSWWSLSLGVQNSIKCLPGLFICYLTHLWNPSASPAKANTNSLSNWDFCVEYFRIEMHHWHKKQREKHPNGKLGIWYPGENRTPFWCLEEKLSVVFPMRNVWIKDCLNSFIFSRIRPIWPIRLQNITFFSECWAL